MFVSTAALYETYKKFPKICTDTRTILPNAIFFALKGDNFNGNVFAKNALAMGAQFAVVDEVEQVTDNRFLLVEDVLESLQALARFHRSQLSIPVLGITGSNGKTTSKELINAAMSKKYKTLATKGNLNNHIGVPLTLLSITADVEFAIIEMGANHQLEIEFLANIAMPDFGLVCNVGKAHLEGMGGFEGVKKTKKELYDHLKIHDGLVFVNKDDADLIQMSAGLQRKIFYGKENSNSVSGKIISADPFLEIEFCLANEISSTTITTHLVGDYNFANVLAAVCIANYFKVSPELIAAGISSYVPENNRSQAVQLVHNKVIMDAYNANPSSMHAAITNFANLQLGNKFLILGDMYELGVESAFEHAQIISLVKSLGLEHVIFAGKEFYKQQQHSFLYFKETNGVADYLKENPLKNHTVLIKGSRGMKLETFKAVLVNIISAIVGIDFLILLN